MKNNLSLKAKCRLSLLLGVGLSLFLGVSVAQAQCPTTRCYVDADVMTSTIDGMSWTTAFTNLQDALTVAISGTEIWVAEGVYYPDEGQGQTDNDVTASFEMKDGVEIYGGFAGTETAHSQRDYVANVTVLSGDIDGNDGKDSHGVVTATGNISGMNAYHVINNNGVSRTAVLDGFTITAGDADAGGSTCPNNCGGGMYNTNSSPQINQVSFSGNSAVVNGGGMYNISSSPVISQVSFSGNSAEDNGGGMYNNNGSNPEMSQVSFSGNRATNSGGGMYNNNGSNPEMSQVSFSGNRADSEGGGMFNENSSPEMSQVSFSGNSAEDNGGGMFNENSSPEISNSIFWQNAATDEPATAQIGNNSSSPMISYTLIQGSGGSSAWDNNLGLNGGNNLDADPLFRGPINPADAPTTAGNLRLEPGCSPAIDVGENSAASGPLDLDGAMRIQGGTVDLGAYESTPATCISISLSKAVSPAMVELDQRVTYTLVLSNSGAASDTVRLSDTVPSGVEFAAWVAQGGAMENANVISWQGPVTAGESITITFAGTNRSLGGSITNTAQFSGSVQAGPTSASYSVFRPRVYVDADVTLMATDGVTWTSAYTNLQDALAVATDGTEIWVAEGVYYPDEGRGQTNDAITASFALKDGVEIYGGFAATETQRSQRDYAANVTVLSGDIDGNDSTLSNGVVSVAANINGANAYNVIRNIGVSSTAVLDGFTITAGDADAGGSTCPNNCGGGMFNNNGSSPQINQISFRGNSARFGGGMFNNNGSNPEISQVSFSGNSAHLNGGGMYNTNSNPEMSQVSFSRNHADSDGGGMFNTSGSNPEMSQVSFSDNRADSDGGGMFNTSGSNPEMSQVSFSRNHADSDGGGMFNTSGSNPEMSQVSFSGNSAIDNGGGMFNTGSSNPEMSQVSFSGNRAVRGGGMYNTGSNPEMSQVSFSDNSAHLNGGGMFNDSSQPQISNSIFWQNAATNLITTAQIANFSGSTPTISYTLIQSSGGSSAWDNDLGMDGGNNLDADPLFRGPGNLRLEGCSPAIDAGDNSAASGPLDLDGATRIQGAGVDLGAYESTPAACISLSKAVSPAMVEPDQRMTYTLVLSNSGSVNDSVRLSDTLPSGVEFAAWVAQGGAMENANVISWQGSVTAGESITITFVGTNRSLGGSITNTAQFSDSLQAGSTRASYTVLNEAIAGLSVQNTSPAALNEVITFTASITAGTNVNYTWDFGDGFSAMGQEVTYLYLQTGTYTATVLASNSINTLTATTRVTVTDIITGRSVVTIAGLTVQNTSPAALNEVITFTANITAGDGVNYRWDFGDGLSTVGQTVTHVYTQVGRYTATVLAINSINRLTATTRVTITEEAIAGLSVQNTSPAALNEVITFTASITAGTNVTYRWDFGDGFSAVGQTVRHFYIQTGTYTAKVEASNSTNSLTATTRVTVTDIITGRSVVTIAGLTVQNSSPAALNEVITFTANITAGDNVNYRWDFGDGFSTVGQTVTHVYTQVGRYTASVLAINSINSLTATTRVTITEPSDEAIAGLTIQNTPVTLNEVVTFTANITAGTNVSYTWQFGDGGSDVGQIVTYVYRQAGMYTATVVASNSTNTLTFTKRVTITSITEPSDEAIAGLTIQNTPVTLNEVVTFTANITAGTNVSYTWDFGDGGSDVGQIVTYVYRQAGMYTATVVASNSTNTLTFTKRVTITSITEPSDEAIAGLTIQNTPVTLNEVVTFTANITAGTNVSYTWQFGDGGSAVGQEVPHVYTEAGRYTATVVASNSTNTLTFTKRVTITSITEPSDEAIAGLTIQNTPVTLNEVVTFTANITAGTNVSYTWQFGDGGSAVGQEVPHVYTQAGTYTATVEASNSINILTATTVVSITPMIERPEIEVPDYLSPVLRLRHFTAYQGGAYSYTVRVSPSLMRTQAPHLLATQVYTLSALTKPPWLDFVDHRNNTGTLMGVPEAAHQGENAVTILATDGQVSSTAVFTIAVVPNQIYLPLVFK